MAAYIDGAEYDNRTELLMITEPAACADGTEQNTIREPSCL